MRKSEIRDLLDQGKKNGDIYLILVLDGFDGDEYELYAKTLDEAKAKVNKYKGMEMQTVFSVYRIDQDWDEQLKHNSCWKV